MFALFLQGRAVEYEVEYELSHRLDACGLFCPEPVMLLHRAVREMATGEVLELIASDPSTRRDVPRFCLFLQHELLVNEPRGQDFCYHIRKRG
ncbi:MAG: sulfurtransferase TusA [Kistimonas sp.]|nr:sulfurtransferase TusA [Kistimonas sp.]